MSNCLLKCCCSPFKSLQRCCWVCKEF